MARFVERLDKESVLRWFEDDSAVRTPRQIAEQLDDKLESWQELGRRLCRAFLAVAA